MKASDLDYGNLVVHISAASWKEVGEDREQKVVLHFADEPKGLVLNKTNGNMIEAILIESRIENWAGKALELYAEQVPFKGQIYDAIRIRRVSTDTIESTAREAEIPF